MQQQQQASSAGEVFGLLQGVFKCAQGERRKRKKFSILLVSLSFSFQEKTYIDSDRLVGWLPRKAVAIWPPVLSS
jgi:hypothetical protein